MALSSPGVQVTVIDQSQYLPAASNSVPLILLATANNKADAAGTGTAPATLASNANKLYQVTSQRDLINLYGSPFFYKTTNGTSIHGYELNEYGLMAAYSLLGTTNRAYVLRADIDLGSLVGQLSRPIGPPEDGTYWLDTMKTKWGIYEFDGTLNKFVNRDPIVLVDSVNIVDYQPVQRIGNIGDYAVVPGQTVYGELFNNTFFYKTKDNEWVPVGTQDWKMSHPTVTATLTPTLLTAGHSFTINVNGSYSMSVTVPSSPNNTVSGIASAINAKNASDVRASVSGNTLRIYYGEYGVNKKITLATTNGTVLDDMGIDDGDYYSPEILFGTSAQMPLWTSSQDNPRPSGSLWIKTSAAGNGMDIALSKYSARTASFNTVTVHKYSSEFTATYGLDASGGKAIPADTIFATVGTGTPESVVEFFRRLTTGPTVITASANNPTIGVGKTLKVGVSLPGTSMASNAFIITTTGTTAASFVIDWASAQIPYTTATVTSDGAIQLTHTLGGMISFSDVGANSQSNGLINQLGFSHTATLGVTKGTLDTYANASLNQNATDGSGTGGLFNIRNSRGHYFVDGASGGTGYAIGDEITINGDRLGGATPANDLKLTVVQVSAGAITTVAIKSGAANPLYYTNLSNWVPLDYIPNEGAPSALPLTGTKWFYSTSTEVDIMVKKGSIWVGYKNTNYDSMGHPTNAGSNATDPLGIILRTSKPTQQTDGTSLVYGDLWLDTSDLENYPSLYRWEEIDGVDQWAAMDNTDQTSSNGILFADARWGTNIYIDPVNDPIPTINSLLASNYVDLDCPNPDLYPQGMLLFNTRRSGYNVKEFRRSYFTQANYPGASLPTHAYTWVSVSGLKEDGSAFMGRKAQRNMVVQALKAAIGTNMSIREEDSFMNLMACPGYPELMPDMVTLNNDRNNTAYIIGDTPLRLADQATDILAWATNAKGATSSGEDAMVTRDTYLGVFYPSGIATDLTGASIVVPASHMMLRTFLRNDTVAYPWLAAAGVRRGTIDNATNIGYLDSTTGEFKTVKNRMSIRDVLYTNQINPLAFFTGVGLLNYGNKNTFDSQSALDRTNVARLVCYIRERLQVAARPFVFEPNDSLTRSQLTGVVQSLFIDLVSKRGLYDYLVVCDESNNTPARIDRNELWVDVAVEPVKAAEFIYIPVRIMNTGEING
jgi:hypothetical protein